MKKMMDSFIEIDINNLVLADWNYKKQNFELSKKLKANIKKNGQIENVIVRELGNGKYEVVNGNHRVEVLQELNFEKVVCCNLGDIPIELAKRIAVETNETKFESNNIELAKIINEILDEETDIYGLEETMPFTLDELSNFQDLVAFDWDAHASEKSDKSEKEESNNEHETSSVDEGPTQQVYSLQFTLNDELREIWDAWKVKCDVMKDRDAFIRMIDLLSLEMD